MVQITGCTFKIGTEAEVTNVKAVIFRSMPGEYQPATVMNTTNPVDFVMFHKWYIGEIHAESEMHDALDKYIDPDGDNTKNLTLTVTGKDTNGNGWAWTFTGVVFVSPGITVEDGKYAVVVYPFVAKNMTQTKPT